MRLVFITLLAIGLISSHVLADSLSDQFASPPASARPWVYWFWNNGNVTRAGITADLEAMQRVGIGGVIIMDVVERFAPPPGTADFMNPEWQELFRFSVSEAHRLGLEINMTNGPGWCGSSGPWITPELSMQKLVATSTAVAGPIVFSDQLPRPQVTDHAEHDSYGSSVKYPEYYQDIAVLGIPQPVDGSAPVDQVMNLTDKLETNGKLKWTVPAGRWIIQRIGHTTTGSSTRPPVKGGNGLECDKLSARAMDVQFANMMGKLITEVGPLAGPTLSATHVDSWEVGTQNWTADFVSEFEKRRGYDPIQYLPNIIGLKTSSPAATDTSGVPITIGDAATAARFRWDFNQTISELLAENYIGHLEHLAHSHGLRLTLEGYDLPFGDEATYTAGADEPMTEFWATGAAQNQAKAREMASVAHIMGRNIVGAEAFTSGDSEQWKMHPATIKALGDYEFSQGVNRFVVHRYAHQPYLDRFPGATMGPWGLHYERTQTWWEMSGAWHEYLSRCQQMLRQGMFTADLCYLRPQHPNQTYFTPSPKMPDGYKYDECTADELIHRMAVRDGRLVLPDGMSYRLLVLPEKFREMTPELAQRVRDLIYQGATVLGPPPTASPSLSKYPDCDVAVKNIAAEVWGDCNGTSVTQHGFGQGRIIWGEPIEKVLEAELQQPPDFTSSTKLNWIHRRTTDAEIFFVASDSPIAIETNCNFHVNGLEPQLWNPETGEISQLAMYEQTDSGISIPIRFEPSGSVFIVFKSQSKKIDPIVSFTRLGVPVIAASKAAEISIQSATYGVLNDPQQTRDVQAKVQARLNSGQFDFKVADMAQGDDPAYGIVKTLVVKFTAAGKAYSITGQDPDLINFMSPLTVEGRAAEVRCDAAGQMQVDAREAGDYELKTASGKSLKATIQSVPAALKLADQWTVSFPPKWGAPPTLALDRLISLSDSQDPGVRYFSGTAAYKRDFDWNAPPGIQAWLNLGEVKVMADVIVNGRDLGVLWKAPFKLNISSALKQGRNSLEIRVANLWPNRMIGDASLPVGQRFTWSSYEPFNKDSLLPRSGLIGPVTIDSIVTAAAN